MIWYNEFRKRFRKYIFYFAFIKNAPDFSKIFKRGVVSLQRNVNIYDIAKLANVSISTVSRVLNGRSDVSPVTRKRVQQIIKDNIYIPNNSARSLSRTVSRAVAVVVNGITNPFFAQMLSVIQAELEKEQFSMILQNHDSCDNFDVMDTAISVYKEKRPRGMLFLGGFFEESHESLQLIKVPVVLATTAIHADCDRSKFSSITIDDAREAYNITSYICRNGHKRIAVIGHHPRAGTISEQRSRGFDKAMRDYGLNATEARLQHEGEFSFEAGYLAAKKLLAVGSYTCIFCFSDVLAIGAMKAIRENGLNIPDDISVVGFDGIQVGEYISPMLTTIKQPADEIARQSVLGLLGSIHTGEPYGHFIMPTTLVEGGSFRPLLT
jgi:LacI family transcriptional regulator